MACPSESSSVGLDARLAESLRTGLPESCRIESSPDRLWLFFPESDFVIHARSTDDPGGIVLVFSVAVRAPEPSLETWWDKWSVPTDRRRQTEVVLDEVLSTRDSVLRMLDERFGDRPCADGAMARVGNI